MREPPATPQLPLDFEKDEPKVAKTTFFKSCNVVSLRVLGSHRRAKPEDEIDSVLEDVLSNAKKLNW